MLRDRINAYVYTADDRYIELRYLIYASAQRTRACTEDRTQSREHSWEMGNRYASGARAAKAARKAQRGMGISCVFGVHIGARMHIAVHSGNTIHTHLVLVDRLASVRLCMLAWRWVGALIALICIGSQCHAMRTATMRIRRTRSLTVFPPRLPELMTTAAATTPMPAGQMTAQSRNSPRDGRSSLF